MDALHTWMVAQCDIVHNGSAIGKSLDYSLKRWTGLSRSLDDGAVSIDNNCVRTRYGLERWGVRTGPLLLGSLRSGKRAAAIMSLIQSDRNNGQDLYAYLKDLLARLPTQRASEIASATVSIRCRVHRCQSLDRCGKSLLDGPNLTKIDWVEDRYRIFSLTAIRLIP